MEENNKEEKLSRRSIKLMEEMYVERDWTDGRFFDEAVEELNRDLKLSEGFLAY